jgi:class 3 adenylate cyclase
VLFTDIVGSTALAAELGDRGWAELLRRHHQVVRAELRRFDGREMDTAGDGFFAVFDDPVPCVACALAIRETLRTLGLEIRAGIHAGDCLIVEGKCTGLAIHIGARLAALGEPGEVLLSESAASLAGSTVPIVDRGTFELRGVPGRRRVYAAG